MRFLKSLACMLALALPACAQDNIVDKVIWVVGDEPILLSDVEEARISSEMNGVPVENPFCVIPEQIAIQKLFLHQAALDSVDISEADVISSVDAQMNNLLQKFGSRENIEFYAHKTYQQLRDMYKKNQRDGLMIETVQRKLVGDIKATPAEVREYFKEMPADSLPFIPTQVEVQIITQAPVPSRDEIERVEEKLREYARRVNAGESDFSTLAMLYSQDGSSRNGGELGYSGRNNWVPEFANVAFSLNDPKKVSKIVRTEFGYHIIQLIDKRGDKINVRHILLKPEIAESEYTEKLQRLDSIANDIREGKFSFETAASVLSDDKDTRNNRGLMAYTDPQTGSMTARFAMKDLQQDVARVVDTMKVGEISRPFRMVAKNGQTVCAIVLLKNRIDGHRANTTEDFQSLKAVVLAKRREAKLDAWIANKIRTTYIRIDKDWRNCDFKYKGWVK